MTAEHESIEVALARLEGKVDTGLANVNGSVGALGGQLRAQNDLLRAAITAGDQVNATAILTLTADVDALKAETHQIRLDAAASRRLIWTTLAAPILVAVVVAILLGTVAR